MAIYDALGDVTLNELILRSLFALGIIIVGVLVGKIVDLLLRKISDKTHLNKHIKKSFIDLTLVIIRWSIYIIFINLGIKQLEIPALTSYFSVFLITIPAITGGLLLLLLGFAIAYYLRRIIHTSETPGWEFISQLVFYFTLLIVGMYSLRIALIPIGEAVRNSIIIVIITVSVAGIVYYFVKRELKKHHSS